MLWTTLEITLFFLLGALLGFLYFWGLWITSRRAVRSPSPFLLLFVSFLVRFLLLGFTFYMVAKSERPFPALAATLAGFLLLRFLLLKRLRIREESGGEP